MTKQELITTLAQKHPDLSKEDVHMAVDIILNTIAKGLAEGKRIEFRGFGSLRLRYRKPRQGRNPRTGTSVPVKGKYFLISNQAVSSGNGSTSQALVTSNSGRKLLNSRVI